MELRAATREPLTRHASCVTNTVPGVAEGVVDRVGDGPERDPARDPFHGLGQVADASRGADAELPVVRVLRACQKAQGVLLPEPLSPITPTRSPGLIVRLARSRTVWPA